MEARELHALLGSRWALGVLEALSDLPQRTSYLKRANPGVSGRMLSETTRVLTSAGLIDREEKQLGVLKRVTYSLTEKGRQALVWSGKAPRWDA